MTIALRQSRSDDTYVSSRVFDGIRPRDAGTSARDRDRALRQLDRLRTEREKRD
jgi:hypothetical protein